MTADGWAGAVRVVVRGLVQGVGFRAWTRHQAQLHGVSGWVRNRRDGSVEAVLAGPSDQVQTLLRALRAGPGGSRIDAVEEFPATEMELAEAPPSGFVQRETV